MKYLLSSVLLLITLLHVKAQNYKIQVVDSELSKSELIDNTMNWLLGYARTSKIEKLKAESSSGESISGDEDYISWIANDEFNLLISNKVKYSKDVLIKYNIQVKVKRNKVLVAIKNVFWKNPRLSEKYPYIPISERGYADSNQEYSEKAHAKILTFFDDYMQKEVFDSLMEFLKNKPETIENW